MIIDEPDLQIGASENDYTDGVITPDNPIIGHTNLATIGNVTAESEETSFPATNLANPATDLYWNSATLNDQDLFVTFNSTTTVDFVAIVNHNFGTADISVELAVNGYEVVIPEFTPEDNSPLLFRFTPRNITQVMISLAPIYEEPFAAVLYVGKLLYLPRRIYVGHTPITMGRSTKFLGGVSESGNFLGRIVTGEKFNSAIKMENLTPLWFRNKMKPFLDGAQENPFMFGWRPKTYPREVGYGWMTNNPQPSNQRSNGMMQVEMQIGGIVG